MELRCIKNLSIDNLKGAWKSEEIILEIRPEYVRISCLEDFEEKTDIKYLDNDNFVKLSDSLIIKQIFEDNSICISYSNKLYIFKKVMG